MSLVNYNSDHSNAINTPYFILEKQSIQKLIYKNKKKPIRNLVHYHSINKTKCLPDDVTYHHLFIYLLNFRFTSHINKFYI